MGCFPSRQKQLKAQQEELRGRLSYQYLVQWDKDLSSFWTGFLEDNHGKVRPCYFELEIWKDFLTRRRSSNVYARFVTHMGWRIMDGRSDVEEVTQFLALLNNRDLWDWLPIVETMLARVGLWIPGVPNAEGQELQSLFWIGLKKTTDEKAAWIKATFPTQDNPISLEDEPLSSSDNPYEKGLRKDERVHLRLLLFGKSTEHALSKAEGRYYADFAGFWFNPKGLRRAWSAAKTYGHEDIERDVYTLPLNCEGFNNFSDEEEAVESEAVKEDEEGVGTDASEMAPKELKAVEEDGETPGGSKITPRDPTEDTAPKEEQSLHEGRESLRSTSALPPPSHPISEPSEAPRPSQGLPVHQNSPENNIRHFRIRIQPPMHCPDNNDRGPVEATSPNKAAKRLIEPEPEYARYVRYRTYSPTRNLEWSREFSHDFYERYRHRDWDEQRELKLEVHKERIKRQTSERIKCQTSKAKKRATPAKPSLGHEDFLKRVDKRLKEVQDLDKDKGFELDELDGDGRQITVEERETGNGEGSSRDQSHE